MLIEKYSKIFPAVQPEGLGLFTKLKNDSMDLGGKAKAQRNADQVSLSKHSSRN